MRKFLVMLAVLFLASWQTMMAANDHFITDAAYRTKVETAFKQKINLVGKQFYDQKMLKQQKATGDEQGALQFLYQSIGLQGCQCTLLIIEGGKISVADRILQLQLFHLGALQLLEWNEVVV